ncbi:putative membrane protein [Lacinutrix venerupis]|uniref:DUF2085 domain-containing protein n=1 Tax=Lacinutrix venerupis TaxID=1486034 RepID=A0AAC9LL03_9FLAO|nr:DUF2085 domain-containing protein [Lacinutrix venerupis]APY00379.1 hypothetical protein BWR22_08630 [Lacinutrix venerupis]RLJ68792.1 putative membrane protein [Lacinutrix venerupis]
MIKISNYSIKGAKLSFSYCHRLPERSFFYKGKQFPLCARCTGINLAYFLIPVFAFGFIKISLWWSIIMILPTYIDGTIQAYTKYESNNILRFTTGIISGIGTVSLLTIIGIAIGKLILTFIH